MDETYVKVKGTWMYLYRAVDSQGNTLEFQLNPTRDAQAAKRFFVKVLGASLRLFATQPKKVLQKPQDGFRAERRSEGKQKLE